ncbi:pantetheine-phosphate adenylyltransferase [Rhodohalobacter sp. SW132]|uniref:pantetheine-phosphate adenylyltransferase n=1 Tax=Rhodohalobacter sp. SW132 TaxID=2293433 RepID=UPI000E248779|nr:pantetheine-phosphate adenylyltransferase [Rhodohalobacter sp. SW132]REL24761.1 pantetheine-phosphate adenylyltransferase [Rhodohalobacter sp. SW132]
MSDDLKIALYPGSFDPFTNGHLDLVQRASKIFDRVIITIAVNSKKETLFTGEEREQQILNAVKDQPWSSQIVVEQFTGLLIDFAAKKKASVLLRGVRQISDFEYEFQMALTNRRLSPELDTVFMMPDENHAITSSSIVKEVAKWGGDVSSFVPPNIHTKILEKYKSK